MTKNALQGFEIKMCFVFRFKCGMKIGFGVFNKDDNKLFSNDNFSEPFVQDCQDFSEIAKHEKIRKRSHKNL